MKEVRFLQIDYSIQKVIWILVLLFLPLLYSGLYFLVPLGFFQVVSSLTMFFIYKDRKRIPHLIFNVFWFTIYLTSKDISFSGALNDFTFIILLPACVGIWYFFLTKEDYEYKLKKEKELKEANAYV